MNTTPHSYYHGCGCPNCSLYENTLRKSVNRDEQVYRLKKLEEIKFKLQKDKEHRLKEIKLKLQKDM